MEQGRTAGVREREGAWDHAIPRMMLSLPRDKSRRDQDWDQAGKTAIEEVRARVEGPDRDQVVFQARVRGADPERPVETDNKWFDDIVQLS